MAEKLWKSCGQVVVKWWMSGGKDVEKMCENDGGVVDEWWKSGGQVVYKWWGRGAKDV